MKLEVIKEEEPWYGKGLSFKCTECGRCCTGAPGYTWISEQEIIAIAEYLQISIEDFAKRYLRKINNKFSLKESAQNYDCVFLKERKCQVYPVRPKQCRTFPWWPKNLRSKEDWEQAAQFCEGINQPDALVSSELIQKIQREHVNEGTE